MPGDIAPPRAVPAAGCIKVAIVEDNSRYREMLAVLIDGTEGHRCVGSYRSMEEALERLPHELPDVVLVDIGLPGMSGIEGVKLLKQRYPTLLLLVLTVYDDSDRIFDALQAGASGYLLKKTPPAQLMQGLSEAVAGGAPMSPEVARRVIGLFREFPPADRAAHQLTPHELRILRLLVEGHSYKSAAAALGVAVPTISFHLQRIYEKLHVHSKTEAVAKALRGRLV